MYDGLDIYHIALECYPVAKVGGLADVVGALPKFQNKLGANAKVVMPWYDKPFIHQYAFDRVFDQTVYLAGNPYYFEVIKESSDVLGFELYLVKVHGLMDRNQVYGYGDSSLQFIGFQRAVLQWLCWQQRKPDVIQCHDYHTGLIPFFIQHCPEYSFLRHVRTIGTIHNGQYQGHMGWDMSRYFAEWDHWYGGLIEWGDVINPLGALIKCSTAFNAVSGGYLQELYQNAVGLESLIRQEGGKAYGIVNGIDTDVWNPETDSFIPANYNVESFSEGRRKNKEELCKRYGLDADAPLFAFIGRFAAEKGADMLPDLISRAIYEFSGRLNFIVLGSGDHALEDRFRGLQNEFPMNVGISLEYNEGLSHLIYASADFLLMPSRVEPCGLNQMYSMRYGTMPIVRLVGGLRDTVRDYGDQGGYGITFQNFNLGDMLYSVSRALYIYFVEPERLISCQQRMMGLNFSWEFSAQNYLLMYRR